MSSEKRVQAYLNFDGKCDEALAFYKRALGAEVEFMMRFKDSPEPPPSGCGPTDANKIMHAQFRIGETVLMASDGRASGNPKFEGTSLSITLSTEDDATLVFDALAKGGTVEMPLGKTFFSPRFGMVTDRFGLTWMVLTASKEGEDIHPAGKKSNQELQAK